MRKFGLAVAIVAIGLFVSQAMGAADFYLSTTPLGGGTPTVGNPSLTLNVGDTATLYLWAKLQSATSISSGMSYVETSPAVIDITTVDVWNGVIKQDFDPDTGDPIQDYYRWNGWQVATTLAGNPAMGWRATGGFNDPQGVWALGLTTTTGTSDPTRTGPSVSDRHWYVGSFTFTATAAGVTDIFITINDNTMLGDTGMIGTVVAPVLLMGGSDTTPLPVVNDGVNPLYIATGSTGPVADATITVTPEPASLALLALGGLALIRRR